MDSKLLYIVNFLLCIVIGVTVGTFFNLMKLIFDISNYWTLLAVPISGLLGNTSGTVIRKLIHNP